MIGNTVGAKQEQKLLVLFSANDWHHHVLLFVLAGKMNCGTQSYILCPASFVAGRLQPNSIHHYDHKKQDAGDHNKNLPKRLFSYSVTFYSLHFISLRNPEICVFVCKQLTLCMCSCSK